MTDHMTEEQAYINDIISQQIHSGLYDTTFIEEYIQEVILEEELQDDIRMDWVKDQIRLANRRQRQAAKTWAKPTDPERLIAAFDVLATKQIIALHHVGFTTADGEEAVIQIEKELRKEGLASKGYCFYHGKDFEDAVFTDYGHLGIAFQIINNEDDASAVLLGNEIKQALEEQGLPVQWDGTSNQKIEVKNIQWQRYYTEDSPNLMDYDRVLDLIIQAAKA